MQIRYIRHIPDDYSQPKTVSLDEFFLFHLRSIGIKDLVKILFEKDLLTVEDLMDLFDLWDKYELIEGIK